MVVLRKQWTTNKEDFSIFKWKCSSAAFLETHSSFPTWPWWQKSHLNLVAEQVLLQEQSPPETPASPTSSALGPNLTSLILFRIRWFVIIPKGSTSWSSWYLKFFPLWKSMMCTTLLVSCWRQSTCTQHEKPHVPANPKSAKALLYWFNFLDIKF